MNKNTAKRKLKIYFPEVEAGYGHIITCRALREAFEKKYGDQFEIITNDFFKSSDNKLVKKYGDMLVNYVDVITGHHPLGIILELIAETFAFVSRWFIMHFPVFGSVKAGIEYMKKINPDIVFSTHWATNYYAMQIKGDRPFSIMYCPDCKMCVPFRMKSDITFIPAETGYESAKKSIFYKNKICLVNVCVRKEAFGLYDKKALLRKELNIDQKKFMVVLAEGGYGNGRTKPIVKRLLAENLPITIVVFAGKNAKVYEELKCFKVPSNTTFIPFGFSNDILKYIACADLFCGKSGNMISEPTFFGVPSIITGTSTLIEVNIMKYYVKTVKTSYWEKNPKKVVKLIKELLVNPAKLEKSRENCLKIHDRFNVEKTADILYDVIKTSLRN